MAERLECPPYLISQIINSEWNQTFNDFLNYYRVEEFKSRIQNPDYIKYSIEGLSHDLGYKSKSTFFKAFKKLEGMTPGEYMKRSKSEMTPFGK